MRPDAAFLLTCSLGAVLALAIPGGALAGPALDQYVEQVPGAGGDKPSQTVDGNSGGGGGSDGGSDGGESSSSTPVASTPVASSELEALEARGEDGAAAARVAAATGPGSREGKLLATSLQGDGDDPISAVFGAVSGGGGSGGLGVALPIILLGVVIGGLALAARGRRGAAGR